MLESSAAPLAPASPPILTLEDFSAVSVLRSREASTALRLRPLAAEVGLVVEAGFLPLVEVLIVVEDEMVEGPDSVGSGVLKPFLTILYWPLCEDRVLVGWRDGWRCR